jgi:hypothetical protein
MSVWYPSFSHATLPLKFDTGDAVGVFQLTATHKPAQYYYYYLYQLQLGLCPVAVLHKQ